MTKAVNREGVQEINFSCPFCNKEVDENDVVRFNPKDNRFAHEQCVLDAQKQYDKDKKKHDGLTN